MRDLIENASRETLVEFVLAVIHGYTIMARDPEWNDDQRAIINNRIHHLAGHALTLVRDHEIDAWKINGIVEHSGNLFPSLLQEPLAILKKPNPGSSPG
ncbi:MAG: hypothetical protein GW858_12995 [Sphingomonadales bacterium]|nr:hypothetical protein [Sphingomonadales bacterium]NCQ21539.1 hypothetical protein [Sphingomonadales bacterium]NCT04325.1 hypothetical protein [Sphingomonadales bacterium]